MGVDEICAAGWGQTGWLDADDRAWSIGALVLLVSAGMADVVPCRVREVGAIVAEGLALERTC